MLYPVAIFPGDDLHAHGLEIPDIPGCISACDELDDALAMAREAADGCLEIMTEQGIPIPTAKTIICYSSKPEFAGCMWALLDMTSRASLSTARSFPHHPTACDKRAELPLTKIALQNVNFYEQQNRQTDKMRRKPRLKLQKNR